MSTYPRESLVGISIFADTSSTHGLDQAYNYEKSDKKNMLSNSY